MGSNPMGLAAEVAVPRLEEGVLVLMDQLFDTTLLTGLEACRIYAGWLGKQPPLLRTIALLHVDVGRFIVLPAVKEEAETLDVLDGSWAHVN